MNSKPKPKPTMPQSATGKPVPSAPPRPVYGWVKIGRTTLHLKIDWEEYDREKKAHKGRVPTHFNMIGFNSTYRVARERVNFDHRYREIPPNA